MKTKEQTLRKIVKAELVLFCLILPVSFFALLKEYKTIPGALEADAIEIRARADSTIDVSWPEARNTETYTLSYREKGSGDWNERKIPGSETSATIRELKEGTAYEITVTANSEKKDGTKKAETTAETKKSQKIIGKPRQQKLAGHGNLNLDSETDIRLSSDDETVAKVEGEQIKFSPGTTVVTAEAQESDEYVSNTAEVEVEVLNSVCKDPAGTSIHIISKLDPSNCELIRTIKDGIPQSFDRNDKGFVVTFGSRDMVSYGDERQSYAAGIDLGHANGFAYSEKTGLYYSVRGRSAACVTCDLENDKYDTISLAYGASGIARDRIRSMFYTSSVTALVSYDDDFKVDKVIAPVKHSGTYYTQDCGGHAGIMMHCVSAEPRHGTNYIDLYDMVNGKYLGSLECDLSEVESAAVDEEGFMLLLCNNSGSEDYIYKTQINIEDLGTDILAAEN